MMNILTKSVGFMGGLGLVMGVWGTEQRSQENLPYGQSTQMPKPLVDTVKQPIFMQHYPLVKALSEAIDFGKLEHLENMSIFKNMIIVREAPNPDDYEEKVDVNMIMEKIKKSYEHQVCWDTIIGALKGGYTKLIFEYEESILMDYPRFSMELYKARIRYCTEKDAPDCMNQSPLLQSLAKVIDFNTLSYAQRETIFSKVRIVPVELNDIKSSVFDVTIEDKIAALRAVFNYVQERKMSPVFSTYFNIK